MKKARTLLILPCTDHKPYTDSVSWRYAIKKLNGHRDDVDLAAIDCITNPKTGRPFGIVMRKQQWKTVGLDEFPDQSKVPEMISIVRKQLQHHQASYTRIIAYVNVKSYWTVLWTLRREHSVVMLPRLYRNPRNWNSTHARISPRGAFYRDFDQVLHVLNRHNKR